MRLTKNTIEEIFRHACESYPDECCGIVTSSEQEQTAHKCENIQNRLHAEDPLSFPRDARTAYFIERSKVDAIVSEAKQQGMAVAAFYHSHPEHEAFFSTEDLAAQTVFGEPEFPDAVQIVVSVKNGRVHDMKCFLWSRERQVFETVNIYE